MIDIDKELQKYGITQEEYENCLKDISDKINCVNDMDWVEIVSKYNLNIHGDTLRKASQTIFGGGFVSEYLKQKNTTDDYKDDYLKSLQIEKNEIYKERQKLRDEKLEYNRWLRELSRDELICERICNEVQKLEKLPLPNPLVKVGGRKETIVTFADAHYGSELKIKGLYGEVINEYNPEIFEKRMEELLAAIIAQIQKEGLTHIKVFSLGDELDGILRVSQLMKLRYGVVESTIKYSDYITRWLTKLTQYATVEFQMVIGNHTELRMLGQPKGTFTKENLSLIVKEFIKTRMADNPNFELVSNETGLIFDNVCGFNVLAIHGEVKNLQKAIQDFTNTYNTMIDILIGGHMHHYQGETVGKYKDVVSVPSIIGIDDYSMTLGKTSNAPKCGGCHRNPSELPEG